MNQATTYDADIERLNESLRKTKQELHKIENLRAQELARRDGIMIGTIMRRQKVHRIHSGGWVNTVVKKKSSLERAKVIKIVPGYDQYKIIGRRIRKDDTLGSNIELRSYQDWKAEPAADE